MISRNILFCFSGGGVVFRSIMKSSKINVLINAKITNNPVFVINHSNVSPKLELIKIFSEEENGVRIEPMLMVIVIP